MYRILTPLFSIGLTLSGQIALAQHHIKKQIGYITSVYQTNEIPGIDSNLIYKDREISTETFYDQEGNLTAYWNRKLDEQGKREGKDSTVIKNGMVILEKDGNLTMLTMYDDGHISLYIVLENGDTLQKENYTFISSDSSGSTALVYCTDKVYDRTDSLFTHYTDSSVQEKRIFMNPNTRMVSYFEYSKHPSGLMNWSRFAIKGAHINWTTTSTTIRLEDGRPLSSKSYENGELISITQHFYENDLETHQVVQYLNYGYTVRTEFKYEFWEPGATHED